MLRYLPGLVLVQIVTLTLFWANQGATLQDHLLRVALPALFFSGVTALWLSMIGRMDAERRNSTLREKHAAERMKLNREIERARSDVMQKASVDRAQLIEQAHSERERLVKSTHKQILQQERSTSRRANVKVGLAFMSVSALGVLFLITELLTLGLLTITTAGGAMGGYLLRWRQSRQTMERLSGDSVVSSTQEKLSVPRRGAGSGAGRELIHEPGLAPISLDVSARPKKSDSTSNNP